MRRILRQIRRGCGTLPHVGEHPGNPMVCLVASILMFIGGWAGLAMFSVVLLPAYLLGAYERAEFSDQLTKKEGLA